jgi:hypothetical protein
MQATRFKSGHMGMQVRHVPHCPAPALGDPAPPVRSLTRGGDGSGMPAARYVTSALVPHIKSLPTSGDWPARRRHAFGWRSRARASTVAHTLSSVWRLAPA